MAITLDGTTGITTPGLTNTGTETIVNLTTTGNTILGDASTDTLNVASGTLVTDGLGKVGIGTATPTRLLDVSNTAGDASVAITSSTTGQSSVWFADTDTNIGGLYYEHTNNAMGFRTNDVERMRIDSSGNVGIGTSSPQSTLDLGSSTNGRSITWEGSAGGGGYGSIWTQYSAGGIWIGSGFKSSIASNTFISTISTASTYRSGISLDGASNNGIRFFTDAAATITKGSAYVPTERMRIDSSGNLGLGVTPSAWGSGRPAVEIGGSTQPTIAFNGSTVANGGGIWTNGYNNGGNNLYKYTGTASRLDTGNGGFAFYLAPSGTAGNAITFTQAMTLDASGNLGIGTTPSYKLDVSIASATTYSTAESARFPSAAISRVANTNGTAGNYCINTMTVQGQSAYLGVVAGASYTPNFVIGRTTAASSFAESMRINADGDVLVGTTGNATTGGIAIIPNANNSLVRIGHSSASGNTAYYMNYYWNGNQIGSIQQSGTTGVTYVTTSDYRLKENVQPLTGALDKVARLKPVTYTWKNTDGEVGEGFIAHELQEVCPLATAGEKDAVNEDGSIKPQGIDTSYLVATLTAAIQELKAELDITKAKVAALEAA